MKKKIFALLFSAVFLLSALIPVRSEASFADRITARGGYLTLYTNGNRLLRPLLKSPPSEEITDKVSIARLPGTTNVVYRLWIVGTIRKIMDIFR